MHALLADWLAVMWATESDGVLNRGARQWLLASLSRLAAAAGDSAVVHSPDPRAAAVGANSAPAA
jgi:hypothetical protein